MARAIPSFLLEDKLDDGALAPDLFDSAGENNFGISKSSSIHYFYGTYHNVHVVENGKRVSEDCSLDGDFDDDNMCWFGESDVDALEKELFGAADDHRLEGERDEVDDMMVYYLSNANIIWEVSHVLRVVAFFLDSLTVEPDKLEEVIEQEITRFWDYHEKVRKGQTNLLNATLISYKLFVALKYYRHTKLHLPEIQHENIHSDLMLCYELINIIEFPDGKASLKACKYLRGWQGLLKGLEPVERGLNKCPSRFPRFPTSDFLLNGPLKGSILDHREQWSNRMSWKNTSLLKMQTFLQNFSLRTTLRENRSAEGNRSEPHEAISFALAYLSVQDLLVVEMVCKSLQRIVRNDSLLWQKICIDDPLNSRLVNGSLLKLVSRSQGNLKRMCLVECTKITHAGLQQVLDISPRLEELHLLGCYNISGEGILNIVKTHKESSMHGLKLLRIDGIRDVKREHIEKLKILLDGGIEQKSKYVKPRFQHNYNYYSARYEDDGRSIDLEPCPKCGNVSLVYDCNRESCQEGNNYNVRECRGCAYCVLHCRKCGRCVQNGEFEEMMEFQVLCSDCSLFCQLRRALQPWLAVTSTRLRSI